MADHSLRSSIHRVLSHLKVQEVERLDDFELLERYAASSDEAAFTALVCRHGPTVLSVCRRVLRGADIDDVFQATFLALAKEASTLRRRKAVVGAWLYEVAYHAALKAKARQARRREVERAAAPSESDTASVDAVVYRDVQQVLDEELHRLPERLRQPLVMIHLLGRTQADAARELGITDRAVRKRLVAGRERLRLGLTRRGVALTATMVAAVLDQTAAAGPVAPSLLRPTVESVLAFAAGEAGVVPATTVSLAMAGTGGWLVHHLKLVSLLAATLTFAAVAFWARALTLTASQDEGLPHETVGRSPTPESDGRTRLLSGQIIATNGQPVPGAAVTALVQRPWKSAERGRHDDVVARTTADAEGRYRIAVPIDFPAWSGERRVTLLAHAAGHAVLATEVPLRGRPAATNLRLAAPVAVQGRLLSPDQTPAAGVRLAVVRLGNAAREPIQGEAPEPQDAHRGSFAGWPADVVSDEAGCFRLEGLAAGESVWLQVQDERFALTTFMVSAGIAEAAAVTLAEPRVLTGSVFDEETGRPLGGARVTVIVGSRRHRWDHYTALAVNPAAAPPAEVDGRADAEGRFRLRLPPDDAYHVYVKPPPGGTQIGRFWSITWPEGETTYKLVMKLPAGVELRGEVVEEDGRPIDGACVTYAAAGYRSSGDHDANPERLLFSSTEALTDTSGRFRIAAPPGACVLRVIGPTADYQLHDYSPKPCPVCGRENVRGFEHARVTVQLTSGARPEPLRLTLRRGTTIPGRAVGPDGTPIRSGVLVCRAVAQPLRSVTPRTFPVQDGAFALPGCIPGRSYPVLLLDTAQKLAGVGELHVPKDGEPAQTVRLAPCGTAVVRLVDATGRPLVNRRPFLQFWLNYDRPSGDPDPVAIGGRPRSMDASWVDLQHYLPGPATDADGRVVLPAIVPGLEYSVSFTGTGGGTYSTKLFRVAPAETLDLPDIVVPLEEADGHVGNSP
jgi:RNA polymerase sigma factor (sigma-70 family)